MIYHIRFIENTVSETVSLEYRLFGFLWLKHYQKFKGKVTISKFKTKHQALVSFLDRNPHVMSYYVHGALKYYRK